MPPPVVALMSKELKASIQFIHLSTTAQIWHLTSGTCQNAFFVIGWWAQHNEQRPHSQQWHVHTRFCVGTWLFGWQCSPLTKPLQSWLEQNA
jgi:hypothetical protein